MAIIGREPPADIIISMPAISARHARIEPMPDGGFWLEDLGSSNGTFVNGSRISGGQRVDFSSQISLGTVRFDLRGYEGQIRIAAQAWAQPAYPVAPAYPPPPMPAAIPVAAPPVAAPIATYCPACGRPLDQRADICPACGVRQRPVTTKNKVAAALLALFLGQFGVHRFYLGEVEIGVIYLIFCWTLIPFIVSKIEFIIYLTMTDEAFNQKYAGI